MSKSNSPDNRPLSPHLEIYKPQITMVMSVFHRITGIGLYFGTLLLVWWLFSAAISETYYLATQAFFGSVIGRVLLFCYTWALIHHGLGGLRHFVWDLGYGFERCCRVWLARATLIGSISLTLVLWLIGYAVR